MRITTRFLLLVLTILTALLAACAQEEDATTLIALSDGEFGTAQLTTPPTDSWITNGGTVFNQRWSPLDKINRENVSQLKGVWRTHLNGSGMDTRNSGEGQPLVYEGLIYNVTGDDDVFALSVKTGEIVWSREASLPADLGRSICCGWISRGLGLGEGKIYVGQLDGKLLALDKDSGELIWEVQAERWEEGYSITSAPLYYDGMVITGFAGAEYGVRGLVKAYDAESGEHLWTFYTVPGPGEFGHDTWPQDNNVWMHGGGTVWQTPAVDPELNLLYFSTGNPGPDFSGGIREGDNLFTASIVAIDASSGEYRWHFQQVHHDIWDYDAPNPVILFDLELEGTARKGLAQASKTGWVYILDRITGEPLIGIEEREVLQNSAQATSATQPYPVGDAFVPQFVDMAPEGVTLVNQGRIFTPFGPGQPAMIQPSPAGSANWAPSSYDPSRQIMYVCAAETAMTLGGGELEIQIPDELTGDLFTGGGFAGAARPQNGVIAALDMTTNKLVWQYRWEDTCYSGFVSTAGDLLFVGRNDGRLTALDIDTGKQLWEFQTGAGMNTTVSIFEDEGEQYVVAYSAGNIFAGSYHGDSMWLFSLNGTLDETTEGDTVRALTQVEPSSDIEVVFAAGDPDIEAGEQLYRQTCLPCHGEDGLTGHGGGAPLNTLTDINQAITVVTTGQNSMPTFGGALTPEQIRDVSAYVLDGLFR
ncbi:PQQ-binding-like beta-propeller repeat protein [Gammaproteobacteria bacterium]|nr:PQQ-binding-like beta-propeller repeat protein [Gammaproteobacteria bacterium]